MKQRLIAALVALSIVVPLLIWGGNIGACVLVFFIMLLAADEWLRMMVPQEKKVWWVFYLGVVFCGAVPIFMPKEILVLPVVVMTVLLATLFLCNDNERALDSAQKVLSGLLYIPCLLVALIWLRLQEQGLELLFFLLLITWAGDTGAYFAGRSFGKNKLFERVSPKKTMEGAIGGALLSMIVSVCVQQLLFPSLGVVHALALGLILDVMGVCGDLVESMFKRAVKVKDSGWIMPGHGGILDRIDSILFTAPTLCAYLYIFVPGMFELVVFTS